MGYYVVPIIAYVLKNTVSLKHPRNFSTEKPQISYGRGVPDYRLEK